MIDPGLRDPRVVAALAGRVRALADGLPRAVTLMEVCGTHTHAIAAAGIRSLLPPAVRLVSGPGCPVCVTPVGFVDHAVALARRPATEVATFGDLLRVPGSETSLERCRAEGGRVAVVYSPREALARAREAPERTVVFLAVGFETTAPTIAAALTEAEATGVRNFEILSGLKTMPGPLRALASDPSLAIDGFLLPGHVSVITGASAFGFLATDLGRPGAVVGFAPVDVLQGVEALLARIRAGAPAVENLYGRVVTASGNATAQSLLARCFRPADAAWRGLGDLPLSGLTLAPELAERDAARHDVARCAPREPPGCRCGDVLRGVIDPPGCALFGGRCTPAEPVGACMVSSEGACAAWHRHGVLRGADLRAGKAGSEVIE